MTLTIGIDFTKYLQAREFNYTRLEGLLNLLGLGQHDNWMVEEFDPIIHMIGSHSNVGEFSGGSWSEKVYVLKDGVWQEASDLNKLVFMQWWCSHRIPTELILGSQAVVSCHHDRGYTGDQKWDRHILRVWFANA